MKIIMTTVLCWHFSKNRDTKPEMFENQFKIRVSVEVVDD
jgi:hypothetical protein